MRGNGKHARLDRRQLLKLLAKAGVISPFVGGIAPLVFSHRASGATTSHKFLQIFLGGGWDANLATDPVLSGSAKATSGAFWPAYYNAGNASYAGAPVVVPGKSLIVGPGLAPAAPAFAAAPTAFVNGLFVEVTAHELAVAYLMSGQLSLSRSREFPAFVATMADKTGGFPAHVILGGGIMPLADTAKSNPPLQSLDIDTFTKMLAGPYQTDSGMKDASIDAAHKLLATLNQNFAERVGSSGKESLSAWRAAETGLPDLYAKKFHERLALTAQMETDFATGTGNARDADGMGAKLALAHMILKEGVSRYVSVLLDGFDTHSNHMASHKPLMLEFAARLNVLVGYLASTNDPDQPTKKLLETTTVLITSEFNRTPNVNGAGGTDHWQTGSAILLGRGIKDDTVVGARDAQGAAADYAGRPMLPDYLAASIMRHLGFATEADALSEVHLDALFT